MNKQSRRKIREWIGVTASVATFAFALVGIISIHEYVSVFGSAAIFVILCGMYKYA
ncbi:MAG: hypothetical protein ACI9FJ_003116 [Alteromonadaceae bacterium]|jgi:hypothetical protein